MTLIDQLLQEKGYRAAAQTIAAPRASPVPLVRPSQSSAPRVISNAVQSLGPLPKGRLSRNTADLTGNTWWWQAEPLGTSTRQEVIREIRLATQLDTDAAGAKRDLVALANPGLTLEFTGSDRAKRQAELALEQLQGQLGDFATWDELANNQLGEIYDAGASSLEWYPTISRGGVGGVEVIPAEEIRIQRQGNSRQHVQNIHNVVLDERTYIYSPYATRQRDPYGTPMAVAALRELARKETLTTGSEKVIALLAEGAFLQIGVPKPTPQELGLEDENDPAYPELLTDFYRAYVELATAARTLGVLATESGVEAKVIPLTGNVSGLSDLEAANNLKVWSGLMTLPFMRGKMDSTTQALAQVVYPILLSHAMNSQLPVKRSLEFGMNLHLRLGGIAARVEAHFADPPNPFLLDHAQAAREQAQTDGVYMEQLGPEYVTKVAMREGLDPQKVQAWRDAQKPAPSPLTLDQAENQKGGDPNANP